jgi:hypothetical protein
MNFKIEDLVLCKMHTLSYVAIHGSFSVYENMFYDVLLCFLRLDQTKCVPRMHYILQIGHPGSSKF